MKTAFIGHRLVLQNDIYTKLYKITEQYIRNGCEYFTLGTHGEFDEIALRVLRNLKDKYNLTIEVVLTSLHKLKPLVSVDEVWGTENYFKYGDVNTIIYDIEEKHYKQRIISSNRQMLDTCDSVICYVDTDRKKSGANKALGYAKKKGLKITNIYSK
ncbi:MAG TPA: hypothetical protein IAD47_03920 [Candidatus Limihabitans stercoravium]|nr:hypothetical protein [Candidatus Limihabitans stercoravium]